MLRYLNACLCLCLWASLAAAQPWQIYSSDYFRIFHRQDEKFAKAVAEHAEAHRDKLAKKWFGKMPDWRVKCDIYLYTSGEEIGRYTGNGWMTGQTIYNFDHGGAVVNLRINMRADLNGAWDNILPHEITHALVAGHFGRPLPRWIDEGMCGQGETEEVMKRHWAVANKQERYWLKDLMKMKDYPERKYVGLFYSQSIILVRHLVLLKGEKTFVRFVIDSNKDGVEAALQKHYKLTIDRLEETWLTVPAPDRKIDETPPDS